MSNPIATSQQTAPTGDGPAVMDFVAEKMDMMIRTRCVDPAEIMSNPDGLSRLLSDLILRKEMGTKKYGTPLRAHNGRQAIVDLYQEIQDAIMYSGQGRMEGDKDAGALFEICVMLGKTLAAQLTKRGL